MTSIAALPFSLRWLSAPVVSSFEDGVLTIEAGAQTDWFVDPSGARDPVANAPALVGEASGDYRLSARVRVDFASSFDAGSLVLWAHEGNWAKLCFEYSPQAQPMVVSVVTSGVSDDCNSLDVDGDEVWLRISRRGSAFVFHASADGERWQFVRHFALEPADRLAVGFETQSPIGEGCTASFADIRFEPRRLEDLRSGE